MIKRLRWEDGIWHQFHIPESYNYNGNLKYFWVARLNAWIKLAHNCFHLPIRFNPRMFSFIRCCPYWKISSLSSATSSPLLLTFNHWHTFRCWYHCFLSYFFLTIPESILHLTTNDISNIHAYTIAEFV